MKNERKPKKGFFGMLRESFSKTGGCCCGPGRDVWRASNSEARSDRRNRPASKRGSQPAQKVSRRLRAGSPSRLRHPGCADVRGSDAAAGGIGGGGDRHRRSGIVVQLFTGRSQDGMMHFAAAMSRALGREVRFEYMTDFLFDSLPEGQAQQLRRGASDHRKVHGGRACVARHEVSERSASVGADQRERESRTLNGVWVAKAEGRSAKTRRPGGKTNQYRATVARGKASEMHYANWRRRR